jgi:dolichyldiphosphatase
MSEASKLGEVALNVSRTMPYTLYQFGILQSLVTQDWTGIYFTGGLFLFGDVLNGLVLKPLFKKLGPNVKMFQRPSQFGTGDGCGIYPNCAASNVHGSWGMSSGHAQMMAIFAVFWIAYLLKYFADANAAGLWVSIIIILIITLLVIFSRVFIGCHNWPQVIVGTLIGSGLGYLLFYIYTLIR